MHLSKVPESERWPGVLGVAVLPGEEPGNVSDDGHWVKNLDFVGVVVVPKGYYADKPRRSAVVAMPLSPKTNGGPIQLAPLGPDHSFDMRGDTQGRPPRLLRAAEKVRAAIEAAGARGRHWERLKDEIGTKPVIVCGETALTDVPKVWKWFPTPYVKCPDNLLHVIQTETANFEAIPETALKVFMRDVKLGIRFRSPVSGTFVKKEDRADHAVVYFSLPDHKEAVVAVPKRTAVHRKFKEVVRVGDEIGFLHPRFPVAEFSGLRGDKLWDALKSRWGKSEVERLYVAWVESQVREAFGQKVLPYSTISIYATSQADCGFVAWEVASLANYFDPETIGFICPPVQQYSWRDLRFSVHDVDVALADPRISMSYLKLPAFNEPPKPKKERMPLAKEPAIE